MPSTLNAKQQIVYDLIVNRSWGKVLSVYGEGGTGKTYVVAKALAALFEKNPDLRICVTAFTHEAVNNIREKFPKELRDKVTFKTTSSLLGQIPWQPSLGEVGFSNPRAFDLAQKWDIIAVDESSMIPLPQSQALLANGVPVIELGDMAQIPPVQAKANNFRDCEERVEVTLTEQRRNGGAIHYVSRLCRDRVYYPVVSWGNLLVHEDRESAFQEFLKKLKCLDNPTEASYLVFTNDLRKELAAKVHQSLYGSNTLGEGQYIRLEQKLSPRDAKGSVLEIREIVERQELCGFDSYKCLLVNKRGECFTEYLLDPDQEYQRLTRMEKLKELAKATKDLDLLEVYTKEYKQLDSSFLEYSSPFVMTLHKSQGRTIKYVWVDTLNVKTSKGAFKRNLLYVGYGRASQELNTIRVESVEGLYDKVRSMLGLSRRHKKFASELGGLSEKTVLYKQEYLTRYYESEFNKTRM